MKMRHWKTRFPVFILGIALATGLMAQQPASELDQLKAQLEQMQKTMQGMQQRVTELEAQNKQQANQSDTPKKVKTKKGWDLDFSGVIFADYRYNLSNSADDYNGFNVGRTYINLKGNKGDWGWRITPDIYRHSDGSYTYRMKYAWLEKREIFPGATFRFGQVELPWVGPEEHLYHYRYQGTIMVDREHYLTSADLGISLAGKGGKVFQYAFAFSNGEGYHAPETNKYKTVAGRFAFTPWAGTDSWAKGLRFSLYQDFGKRAQHDVRTRSIAMISYDSRPFWVGLQHVWAKDPAAARLKYDPSVIASPMGYAHGSLWSLWLGGRFAEKWTVLGRYDRVDPDTNLQSNSHWRGIFGIAYDFTPNVTMMLDSDYVAYQKGALMGTKTHQHWLATHLQIAW